MPMFPRPIRTRGAPGATCVYQRTPISPPCGTPRVLIDRCNAIVLPHKKNRHCGSALPGVGGSAETPRPRESRPCSIR
eukprot:6628139-Prymnesium_polylepis.1